MSWGFIAQEFSPRPFLHWNTWFRSPLRKRRKVRLLCIPTNSHRIGSMDRSACMLAQSLSQSLQNTPFFCSEKDGHVIGAWQNDNHSTGSTHLKRQIAISSVSFLCEYKRRLLHLRRLTLPFQNKCFCLITSSELPWTIAIIRMRTVGGRWRFWKNRMFWLIVQCKYTYSNVPSFLWREGTGGISGLFTFVTLMQKPIKADVFSFLSP